MLQSEIRDRIDFIFTHYDPSEGQSALFRRLGAELASIIGRPAPFSRSYCSAIYHNNLAEGKSPGGDFILALEALSAHLENPNVPAMIQAARIAEVLTWADANLNGAFVAGVATLCAEPGCNLRFVGRVPWQIYCPIHTRGIKR